MKSTRLQNISWDKSFRPDVLTTLAGCATEQMASERSLRRVSTGVVVVEASLSVRRLPLVGKNPALNSVRRGRVGIYM